jgi:hypothetical protein
MTPPSDESYQKYVPCPGHPLFTVPIARAVGGTDLSLPVGLLVSAGVISF